MHPLEPKRMNVILITSNLNVKIKPIQMKRFVISMFFGFIFVSFYAAPKVNYPVSQIPDSLQTNAYSVVRFESTDFGYSDPQYAVQHVIRVVTILDEKGSDEADLSVDLGKFWDLNKFSGEIYDQNGKLIRKIKTSDLHSSSLSPELATDESVSFYECSESSYPFTIMYEYEVKWKNGIIAFPPFEPMEALQQSVQHAEYHLKVPVGTKFQLYAQNMSDHAETTTGKGNEEYTWNLNGIKAIDEESYMPQLTKLAPSLQLEPDNFSYDKSTGTLNSWNELGKWSWGLLQQRDELPPQAVEKIKEIVANATSDKEKVERLYHYLQTTTRYVSIQLGIGGYQPMSAAAVFQTGFSDCKGLSNYLRAMLEVVGIPSYYTIISTTHPRFIHDFASPLQADHVILVVPLGKDTIPLECTSTELPFGYVHSEIAGHDALLVTPEGGKLFRLPTYPDTANFTHTLMQIQLEKNGSMKAKARSIYTLANYEEMIPFEKMADSDERIKFIKADYRLPSMQIANIHVVEKHDELPAMTLNYTLSSDMYSNQSGTRLFVPVNPLKNKYAFFARKIRKYPFVIRDGNVECDTILITIPVGMKVERLPSDVSLKKMFGSFSSDASLQGNLLEIVQRVDIPKGKFPASNNEDFKSFMDAINLAYEDQIVLKML
jgi:hypothetical protein